MACLLLQRDLAHDYIARHGSHQAGSAVRPRLCLEDKLYRFCDIAFFSERSRPALCQHARHACQKLR